MRLAWGARRWAADLASALARASEVTAELRALHDGVYRSVLQKARVIGCTSTGAALFRELLRDKDVAPGVVMVEEAGELLEAHVLASLSKDTEHLIMVRWVESGLSLGGRVLSFRAAGVLPWGARSRPS